MCSILVTVLGEIVQFDMTHMQLIEWIFSSHNKWEFGFLLRIAQIIWGWFERGITQMKTHNTFYEQ